MNIKTAPTSTQTTHTNRNPRNHAGTPPQDCPRPDPNNTTTDPAAPTGNDWRQRSEAGGKGAEPVGVRDGIRESVS